jgi:4-diphosphocytidyl-2-C-methyl-D-erythritol kinase
MKMKLPSLRLPAPAKINLWLRILGKREDGFHAVETRMVPISMADEVVLEEQASGPVTLTCSDASVPVDESNLALRALRAFEDATGIRKGWKMHLEKRIPHGAGLGGGSSNAAAVLKGLNELCGNPLALERLLQIAASLGSDVPFFLHGTPCDATGRGEIVAPVDFPWHLPLVLIKPPFGVATPWAYQHWADSTELDGVLYAPQITTWGELGNDLERPVFQKWIFLPTLKTWLLDQPETKAALMSGSGSTLFAIARDGVAAAALAKKAQVFCGDSAWVQIAETR